MNNPRVFLVSRLRGKQNQNPKILFLNIRESQKYQILFCIIDDFLKRDNKRLYLKLSDQNKGLYLSNLIETLKVI